MTYPMRPFQLHRPKTIEEAVGLAGQFPNSKYLAGGTDLLVNIRRRIAEPDHVIGLTDIGELSDLRQEGESLRIGAGVSLTDLAQNETIHQRIPMLAEAAASVAGPTIRQMATLGGNIVLDTRCKYYNQSYFWRKSIDFCLKKEGTLCHVAPGGKFCWAAFSGDTPPALLLLDAELELVGPEGERRQALSGFYGKDARWSVGQSEGGVKAGEMIAAIHITLPEEGWQGVYEKTRVRDSIDFPLAGMAMALQRDKGGIITGLRAALTAVNPRPFEIPGLDEFIGKSLTLEVVEAVSKIAHRTGKPMRTTVADPAYRNGLINALVEKTIARLAPELIPGLDQKSQWSEARGA